MTKYFLALDIPTSVQRALTALVRDLRQYAEDLDWMDPERLHITMRYFGALQPADLQGPLVQRIGALARSWQPAKLLCGGIGVFPNWKYPRVVWAGFLGDTAPVLDLHDALNIVLADLPLEPDRRAFRLHLTLGRAKAIRGKVSLVKRVESLGLLQFGDVPVTQLTLYKSELTPAGSVYTAIERFQLGN